MKDSGMEMKSVESGSPKPGTGLTLAEVRKKLAGQTGKKYWRSLDELAGTPEFEAAVQQEFPQHSSEWIDPVSRRGFMKLMGASMALAGLAGCTKQPDEPIYPYVKAPEDLILGKPIYFATAFPFPTGAVPLLSQERCLSSHQGRRQSGASGDQGRLGPDYAGNAARSL